MKIPLGILLIGLSGQLWAADLPLKTEEDKVSYSLGADIGRHFREQGIKVKAEPFMKALTQAQNDEPLSMTQEEMKTALVSLQTKLLEKQNEERKMAAEKNLKEGEAFLEKNKTKPGIKVTPSGLQYLVVEEGKGASPKEKDKVVVNYRGTFIDGTEFDSSYSRGEPIEFTVNGVIPGWTEALQMMKPGAKWEIFIPSKLAYGEHGVGNIIGPNSALLFQVELLEVHPQK